jgi:hypothetical protein
MAPRFAALLLLAVGPAVLAARLNHETIPRPARVAADLSGRWDGTGWGTVTLHRTPGGAYAGTYTDTYGKHTGRIELRPSREPGRYEGNWAEGDYRFGRLVVQTSLPAVIIRGSYGADAKCRHRPGLPVREEFQLRRTR